MQSSIISKSNPAPLPVMDLPAELRNHIHKYLAANIASGGSSLRNVSGYLLTSQQTRQEVSSVILVALSETLREVEQEFEKRTRDKIRIDKPSTLSAANSQ